MGRIVRLLVMAIIFTLIARQLDFRSTGEVLARSSLIPILLSLLLFLVNRLLSALKWGLLLQHNGIIVPFGRLLRIIFESNLLGIMVPSGIGPDLVRLVQLGRKEGSLTAVTGSVLADRMLAVMTLAAMTVAASVFSWPLIGEKGVVIFALCAGLTAITIILLCLGNASFRFYSALHRGFFGFLGGALIPRSFPEKLLEKAQRIHSSFAALLDKPRLFAEVVLINLLVQLFRVGQIHFLFMATGTQVPVLLELAFVPIILLLILMPFVPYMGLGVKEAAFIYFFGYAGIAKEVSFSVSILSHLVVIAGLLPGVIVFFGGSGTPRHTVGSSPGEEP